MHHTNEINTLTIHTHHMTLKLIKTTKRNRKRLNTSQISAYSATERPLTSGRNRFHRPLSCITQVYQTYTYTYECSISISISNGYLYSSYALTNTQTLQYKYNFLPKNNIPYTIYVTLLFARRSAYTFN